MEKISEASLGYFMNPLVSVFLGWLVLRETLGRLQWFAVALAVFAILIELSLSQSFPIVSVVLAVSFGFYGLIRKRLAVPSILGLFVETSFVWPMAAVFLFLSGSLGGDRDVTEIGMLAIGGLVTIVPLLCFAFSGTSAAVSYSRIHTIFGPNHLFTCGDSNIRGVC